MELIDVSRMFNSMFVVLVKVTLTLVNISVYVSGDMNITKHRRPCFK